MEDGLSLLIGKEKIGEIGVVKKSLAQKFDIKAPILFADLYWDLIKQRTTGKIKVKEIAKYPTVERDLAVVVPKTMPFGEIEEGIKKLRLTQLQELTLFDIFESEKLGKDKKSLAVNFTFLDEEKTLTDKEIDGWMNKIMMTLEKDLQAEIRK